jgi:hypothetical protein
MNNARSEPVKSSNKEFSLSIPLKNRPGVQRKTPWEKKQFPVKDADGNIYLADGYRATFDGFNKTRLRASQENLIVLLPGKNAGKLWFGVEPYKMPMHFFDTGSEIIACGIGGPQIFWATSLTGEKIYSNKFEPTETNMDKLAEVFYPDFIAWAHYRIILLKDLVPHIKDGIDSHAISFDCFTENMEILGIEAKEDCVAFLLTDLEKPGLKARIWLKLPLGKVLNSEIFHQPIGENNGKVKIFSEIPKTKRGREVKRIAPWAEKKFQVASINGQTYSIKGYLASFSGIKWKNSMKNPTNIVFLFDNKRPGKIWMGLNMKEIPCHFIDTGEEILGCWLGWDNILAWDASLDLTEADKTNFEPSEENLDRLVKCYYPNNSPFTNQNFSINFYFPKIDDWTSFDARLGAGIHDTIELKEIKAKDGNFGFLLQNMDRPHVKGWLWVKFPEARVVKAELIDDGTSSRTQDKASTEMPPP